MSQRRPPASPLPEARPEGSPRAARRSLRHLVGGFSLFNAWLLLVFVLYFTRILVAHGGATALSAGTMVGALAGAAFLHFLSRLVEELPFAGGRGIVMLALIFYYCGSGAYHLCTGAPVDVWLLTANVANVFSREAVAFVMAKLDATERVLWLALPGCFLVAAIATRSFARRKSPCWRRALVSLSLAGLAVFVPSERRDELSLQLRHAAGGGWRGAAVSSESARYPLLRFGIRETGIRSSIPPSLRRGPNVLLLMIESFNANFVEARAPSGIAYTPVFDRLIPEGIYVERFYGNSVQTCKGQAATFFSIIPAMKGKLSNSYPDLVIEGFPAMLARRGYATVFFQAHHDLSFDNTRPFMKKAGFQEIHSFGEFRRDADAATTWGWGVEDGTFYERFFDYLDTLHARRPEQPVFAALATVGTHFPFNQVPPERRAVYAEPKETVEHYANALHLADSHLEILLDSLHRRPYLANTIVILTADHGFPMHEHGTYANELCHFDEAFRVPFLLLWQGALRPERVSGRAYSQMDIGPTLCDLLGVCAQPNTLQGISIFDRTLPHPVPLVQPYNGGYLGVVDYPLKYTVHLRSRRELVFDLAADPMERRDLGGRDPARAARLRPLIQPILLTQRLFEANRLRPPPPR